MGILIIQSITDHMAKHYKPLSSMSMGGKIMTRLKAGLRVIYRPGLLDSFTSPLAKGSTGTICNDGWFGLYKDPGHHFPNVMWDNGSNERVTRESLERI
jgi:hypothetical protein